MTQNLAVSPAVAPEFLPMLEAGRKMAFTRKGLVELYPNLTDRQIRTLTEKAEAQGLIERDPSPSAVSGTTFVVYGLTEKGRSFLPKPVAPVTPTRRRVAIKAPNLNPQVNDSEEAPLLNLVPKADGSFSSEPNPNAGKPVKSKKAPKKAKAAKSPKVPDGELPEWAEVPPTQGQGFTTEPTTGNRFAVEPVDVDQWDVVVEGVGVIDRVRKVKSSRYPNGSGFSPKGDPNGNPQRTLTSACRSSIRHWNIRGRKPLETTRAAKDQGAPTTTF